MKLKRKLSPYGSEYHNKNELFSPKNSNKDSKLALFLKSGNDYVGATKEINLYEFGNDFSLKNEYIKLFISVANGENNFS